MAWSAQIPAQDSLLVWLCWFSGSRTSREKFSFCCPLNLVSQICSVTVINIRMMTAIHQCQVWVFSQNKTTYYSDQLHSYHCDDLTNWFLRNFFPRLKFCSHQQWSSDFSTDEIYNETTGFCKIDGSEVEIAVAAESTFLNYKTRKVWSFLDFCWCILLLSVLSLWCWLSWSLCVVW